MKYSDMTCEFCDYFEPWESEGSYLISSGQEHDYKSRWTLELNGSCRRFPPEIRPSSDSFEFPGYPMFPVVSKNYWCGEGRWTDPANGERYYWGDWDE
ncbi:hypothetical protein [Desulfomonile tiedjei]|uniref:hypothetical protein n=1 Tax=Desulfomonile tiedjei TaxID=2358 RepID=UPI00031B3A77|nr:hypothetical protein [Desulfomonile tiedjei]